MVIDLKENIIYNTNDLNYLINEDKLDRFGSSVSCSNKNDLLNEIKENVVELEQYYGTKEDLEKEA
jgi:ribosomal protein L32E